MRIARAADCLTVRASSSTRRPRTSAATIEAGVLHRRRHLRRLAAGRGAGVEDALAGRRRDERADELRRFVLDDERARCASGVSSGLPAVTIRPSAAKRAGSVVTPAAARSRGERVTRRAAAC